jgi:hypothetical protein
MSNAPAAIEEDDGQWCVLLPLSGSERWAVPQNALAEIVTLHTDSGEPPEELAWRGELVPVLDFGHDDGVPWRERVGGTGLVAVFLGLERENCKYWGMAVRGTDLAVKQLLPDQVDDAPDEVVEHASAAFTLDGIIYQVPDLVALQRRVAASMDAA